MQISGGMPRLDIHTTNATIQIKREPMRLVVESSRPKMKVKTVRPKMKVNWDKVYSQTGRAKPNAYRQMSAQRARRKMMEGISNTNQFYLGVSNIHDHQIGAHDVVAKVTFSQLSLNDAPVVDFGSAPQSLPEVDWEQGDIQIEWEPSQLEMRWEGDVFPEITVTPHMVEIRLINGETVRVAESEAKSIERQGYGRVIDEEV